MDKFIALSPYFIALGLGLIILGLTQSPQSALIGTGCFFVGYSIGAHPRYSN